MAVTGVLVLTLALTNAPPLAAQVISSEPTTPARPQPVIVAAVVPS